MNDPDLLWADVCDVMNARRDHGWWFDYVTETWNFGLGGTALLVVSMIEQRHRCFLVLLDKQTDDESDYRSVAALLADLPELELRNRGLTGQQREMMADPDLDLDPAWLAGLMAAKEAQDRALS